MNTSWSRLMSPEDFFSGGGGSEDPDTILTYPEAGQWVACWTYRDLMAQGKTEVEALDRLAKLIGSQAIWDVRDGVEPFSRVDVPSEGLVSDWRRWHEEAHASKQTLPKLPPEKGRRKSRGWR